MAYHPPRLFFVAPHQTQGTQQLGAPPEETRAAIWASSNGDSVNDGEWAWTWVEIEHGLPPSGGKASQDGRRGLRQITPPDPAIWGIGDRSEHRGTLIAVGRHLCDLCRHDANAECACGRVHVSVESEPFLVATCHCDFCQKRTGSVFQVGAYFAVDEELEVRGEIKTYNGLEIDGVGNAAGDSVTYYFCPTCGSTVYWIREGVMPLMGIAVGNFADPAFPAPTMEVHIDTRHDWVAPVAGAQQLEDVHREK